MTSINSLLTHPGGAHKDEFLACCVLLALHPVSIARREPTAEDLEDPGVCVIDVGHEHDPLRTISTITSFLRTRRRPAPYPWYFNTWAFTRMPAIFASGLSPQNGLTAAALSAQRSGWVLKDPSLIN